MMAMISLLELIIMIFIEASKLIFIIITRIIIITMMMINDDYSYSAAIEIESAQRGAIGVSPSHDGNH